MTESKEARQPLGPVSPGQTLLAERTALWTSQSLCLIHLLTVRQSFRCSWGCWGNHGESKITLAMTPQWTKLIFPKRWLLGKKLCSWDIYFMTPPVSREHVFLMLYKKRSPDNGEKWSHKDAVSVLKCSEFEVMLQFHAQAVSQSWALQQRQLPALQVSEWVKRTQTGFPAAQISVVDWSHKVKSVSLQWAVPQQSVSLHLD